jgi:SAM-dependent methyltransferase
MPRPDPGPDKGTITSSYSGAGTILLGDLCEWREQLARCIARNNIGIRSGEIALAIHRILFRFCILALAEDRGLISRGILWQIADADDSGIRLEEFFSGIGDPWAGTEKDTGTHHRHKPVPENHHVTDNKIIRTIAIRLASADRPYNFSLLSLEEIARILDRYLARTIRRSAVHQAVVVDRPGCTAGPSPDPAFLDYAVTNTVSAALVGRSPTEPLPLRILDPACGAGSLLLRAYHNLLCQKKHKQHTFAERKDIIEQTLFGLDIDPHAVAAARVLLAFAICEGENSKTLHGGFFTALDNLLHSLSGTIRCGNALVNPEIADDESWAFCPVHERHAIQHFDWKDAFFEILAPGGFDAVISCPPESLVPAREWFQRYFQRHYIVYDSGAKISAFYIEKVFGLLRPHGVAGFVTGTWWLHTKAGLPLRELLLTHQIEEILFSGYKGENICFLRLTNVCQVHPFVVRYTAAIAGSGDISLGGTAGFPVSQQELSAGGWRFCDTREERLVEKISRVCSPLETSVLGGIRYTHEYEIPDSLIIDASERKRMIQGNNVCKTLVRPYISGEMIHRYGISSPQKFCIFIPKGWTGRHAPTPGQEFTWFKTRCPGIARYLEEHKAFHDNGQMKDGCWLERSCGVDTSEEEKTRIIFSFTLFPPCFTLGSGPTIFGDYTGIISSGSRFLLGLLNSRLASFVFVHLAGKYNPVCHENPGKIVGQFPVYTPDLDDATDKARHDRLETLVTEILDLHLHFGHATTDREKQMIVREIESADKQIDSLVYGIYGLTADEIEVVESTLTAMKSRS